MYIKLVVFLIYLPVDTNCAVSVKVAESNVKREEKSITNVIVSTLYPLKENDEVTLVITSENITNLIFYETTNVSLSVTKNRLIIKIREII